MPHVTVAISEVRVVLAWAILIVGGVWVDAVVPWKACRVGMKDTALDAHYVCVGLESGRRPDNNNFNNNKDWWKQRNKP